MKANDEASENMDPRVVSVLNNIYQPSLEIRASVKVALLLWYQKDVQDQFIDVPHGPRRLDAIELYKISLHQHRDRAVQKCAENLKFLNIPFRIKKRVYSMVKSIADEMVKWVFLNNTEIFGRLNAIWYVNRIVWTSRAVVDYVETANVLRKVIPKDNKPIGERQVILLWYVLDSVAISGAEHEYRTRAANDRIRQCKYDRDRIHLNGMTFTFFNLLHWYRHNETGAALWFMNQIRQSSVKMKQELISELPFDMLYLLVQRLTLEQQSALFRDSVLVSAIIKNLDCAIWEDCFGYFLAHISWFITKNLFLELITSMVRAISADRHLKGDGDFYRVDYDRSQFMLSTLWSCVPRPLKDHAITHNNSEFLWTLLSSLSFENHRDAIEFVFRSVNADVKKNMVATEQGVQLCRRVCLKCNIKHIDILLSSVFPSIDANEFKRHLCDTYRDEICAYIFYRRSVEELDIFFSWCFDSDEERSEYRQKLPQTVFTLLLQLCVMGGDTPVEKGSMEKQIQQCSDFSSIDYFLSWCFESNEEQIREFKRSRILREDSYLLDMLAKRDIDYNFMDIELLKWFYVNDRSLIEKFRERLCKSAWRAMKMRI